MRHGETRASVGQRRHCQSSRLDGVLKLVGPKRWTWFIRFSTRLARLAIVVVGFGACTKESQPSRAPERCYVHQDGQKLFMGTADCLKTLPARRMHGVWVLGHEYSAFYEGSEAPVPVRSPEGHSGREVWLEVDVETTLRRFGKKFDGKTRQYEVDFIGTKSDVPGYYGDGLFKRGALVLKMMSLQELPERPQGHQQKYG